MEIEFKNKKFLIQEGITHPAYSVATFTEEELDFRNKYWNIKENDVVIDVGTSYGAYTLTAAALGAKVYCFEPEITVYNDLVKNIELNKFNCTAYNLALWSEPTLVDMKVYAPHWPEHTITSKYRAETLDNIFMCQNISKIDWLKIDVEGVEEHVINGAKELISKFKPKLIVECHDFMDASISSRVKELINAINPDYYFKEISREPCVILLAKG